MGVQTAWAILPVAFAGYALGGVGHGVKNVLLRALLMARVPEAVHGRAFAAYNAARNTAELGAVGLGGVAVSALGPRAALLLAGLGPIVAALGGAQRPPGGTCVRHVRLGGSVVAHVRRAATRASRSWAARARRGRVGRGGRPPVLGPGASAGSSAQRSRKAAMPIPIGSTSLSATRSPAATTASAWTTTAARHHVLSGSR